MSGGSRPRLPPCWGIGLPRSGTNSLCEALQILGYRRVVHNPRFEELRHLDGGADLGVLVFYKYLDFKFPGSRFVLTMRPLESWLESVAYNVARHRPLTAADDVAVMRRMTVFETVVFDRERLLAGYQRHHADVRRYFRDRPHDLLEFDIVSGQGWERLCPFLGTEPPRQPFPHAHARSNLEEP